VRGGEIFRAVIPNFLKSVGGSVGAWVTFRSFVIVLADLRHLENTSLNVFISFNTIWSCSTAFPCIKSKREIFADFEENGSCRG
jgi:hypothetical protein